jgi:hypothetical protein
MVTLLPWIQTFLIVYHGFACFVQVQGELFLTRWYGIEFDMLVTPPASELSERGKRSITGACTEMV